MSEEIIYTLDGSDTEMNSAIQMAQRTFQEFVEELELESRRIVPALEAAIVKAFFFDPDTPDQGEHMFVDDIRLEGENIHGVVCGAPQSVKSVTEGQKVSFPISRVSDWLVVVNGRGKGGYTIDVIARRMDIEAFHAVENHPPFSWFAWRTHRVTGS